MEYEIESNISNISLQTFDIKDRIDSSIVKTLDIKENITINNSTTSAIITSDIYGFEVMIDNLIINAIKYNKKDGFINISNKNNILYIEDSGFGIDTKNLFKVYDKYFQEDSLHQGFGLGLNIVKEYCDKYKIIIKIDSKEGVGTTFSLDYTAILEG
jgi:signal transduction histidine kinase